MKVHLIDGTYELFRHYFVVPSRTAKDGTEVGATLGVLRSILGMIEGGATHVGVASDHVIESFRNDLFPGYKTGEGVEPALKNQFVVLEEALEAMGVTVWPMIEFEADDALAAAATVAAKDKRVEQVIVCTPDKDLAQCVRGTHVVQLDRRNNVLRDEQGVIERFGVPPASIPDYLALTGDSADGFPGLAGWGAKAASVLLARYGTLEAIPDDAASWDVPIRGAARLAATLAAGRDDAILYRTLARLREDVPVGKVDDWKWNGPRNDFAEVARSLGDDSIHQRARAALQNQRS